MLEIFNSNENTISNYRYRKINKLSVLKFELNLNKHKILNFNIKYYFKLELLQD